MGKITAHLDYVRYTVQWQDVLSEVNNLYHATPHGELFQFTGETFSPGQGYTNGMRMIAGAVMWHSARPQQGIGVVLTGQDLESMRSEGLDEIELLNFIAAVGGHCTTLHGCINAHDMGADVSSLIKHHEAGTLETSARNIGVYTSKTKVNGSWQQGDTLYVGSAKSERQVRIYNKASQLGVNGDWTRLEIVWRGPYAKSAEDAIRSGGIASVVRSELRGLIGCSEQWYTQIITGDLTSPLQVPRKPTARAKWLINVVIPALESELRLEKQEGRKDVYRAFKEVFDKPF